MSLSRRRLALALLVVLAVTLGPLQPPQALGAQDTSDPEDAAVYYSELEAEGRFSRLYREMHPDARRLIPKEVVVGWYENEIAPRGPGVVTVEAVDYGPWTWDVNGKTYRNAAEITYTQPFADGSVERDTIHLVKRSGEWLWFFGPSREFVDAQIEIYAVSDQPAQEVSQESAQQGRSTEISYEDYTNPVYCQEVKEGLGSTVYGICDWSFGLGDSASCIEGQFSVHGRHYLCRSGSGLLGKGVPDEVTLYNALERIYTVAIHVSCESVGNRLAIEEYVCDWPSYYPDPEDCIEDPSRVSFGRDYYFLCR